MSFRGFAPVLAGVAAVVGVLGLVDAGLVVDFMKTFFFIFLALFALPLVGGLFFWL